jgi:hypothetical protein
MGGCMRRAPRGWLLWCVVLLADGSGQVHRPECRIACTCRPPQRHRFNPDARLSEAVIPSGSAGFGSLDQVCPIPTKLAASSFAQPILSGRRRQRTWRLRGSAAPRDALLQPRSTTGSQADSCGIRVCGRAAQARLLNVRLPHAIDVLGAARSWPPLAAHQELDPPLCHTRSRAWCFSREQRCR